MINFEGGAIPEEYQNEYIVDRIEATSTTLARRHSRLRAMPRPQIRSVHAKRLLQFRSILQQRSGKRARRLQRQRCPVLAIATPAAGQHETDAARSDKGRRTQKSPPLSRLGAAPSARYPFRMSLQDWLHEYAFETRSRTDCIRTSPAKLSGKLTYRMAALGRAADLGRRASSFVRRRRVHFRQRRHSPSLSGFNPMDPRAWSPAALWEVAQRRRRYEIALDYCKSRLQRHRSDARRRSHSGHEVKSNEGSNRLERLEPHRRFV